VVERIWNQKSNVGRRGKKSQEKEEKNSEFL
jgi:hypothetical protein